MIPPPAIRRRTPSPTSVKDLPTPRQLMEQFDALDELEGIHGELDLQFLQDEILGDARKDAVQEDQGSKKRTTSELRKLFDRSVVG